MLGSRPPASSDGVRVVVELERTFTSSAGAEEGKQLALKRENLEIAPRAQAASQQLPTRRGPVPSPPAPRAQGAPPAPDAGPGLGALLAGAGLAIAAAAAVDYFSAPRSRRGDGREW